MSHKFPILLYHRIGPRNGSYMDAYPFDPTLFYDDMHTTPAGSQKVGHELLAWMLKSDLMASLKAGNRP